SGGFHPHCAGAIAKDDAGSAVLIIDNGGHYVSANCHYALVRAGFYELDCRLQSIDKAGARGGNVIAPCPCGANLVLHNARRGGEKHVRCDRTQENSFNFAAGNPTLLQSAFGRRNGKIGRSHAFVDNMTLADAGALDDPLVRGFNHLFQISIGQKTRWDVGSKGRDFCPYKFRQKSSPGSRGLNLYCKRFCTELEWLAVI